MNPSEHLEGWRARILAEFPPVKAESLVEAVLVSDPDGLLADELLQTELLTRGYQLTAYDDPMVFRSFYEKSWRAVLEAGTGGASLGVVWSVGQVGLDRTIPFDLLSSGRRVHLSLAMIFPRLAPVALSALDPRYFDALWLAIHGDDTAFRGQDSTRDLLLERVFELDVFGISRAKRPAARLLSGLLKLHFQGHVLPIPLVERAVVRLQNVKGLEDWPLALLLGDRASFLTFVHRAWVYWLEQLFKLPGGADTEGHLPATLFHPTSVFEDREVGAWLDSFFVHGLLAPHPLSAELRVPTQQAWILVGIAQDARKDAQHRLERLLTSLEESPELPLELSPWTVWRTLALGLAEATALHHQAELPEGAKLSKQLNERVRSADPPFLAYLLQRFGSLASLPFYSGPVMAHQVARFMASRRTQGAERVALLVMDGLALDQWAVMKTALAPLTCPVQWEDSAIFAWIPTLTSVSRQAIFAGQLPRDFASSLSGTSAEPVRWRKFWDGQGVPISQVKYLGLIKPKTEAEVLDAVQDPVNRVLGGVIPVVDELIHDFPLSRAALMPTLKTWAAEGFLSRLLDALLAEGYEVFLTADHGNVEAKGTGKLDEGKLADIRGERSRVYSSETLRQSGASQTSGSVLWPGFGLPEDFLALLAPSGGAFVKQGERLLCHGGASLFEVMVPFVHLRRRTD